ncbi:MAG: hypothetical protein HONDAALG_01680 [Gammaproteobacteria bacterium]|nr:hypothetical protein [Gammaproteobacteria bacterium]
MNAGARPRLSPGMWRRICAISLLVLITAGWLGNTLEGRIGRPGMVGLAAVIDVALLAFIVSIPPVLVRGLIDVQRLIGNSDVAAVRFLERNERGVVRLMWIVWLLGALLAAPFVIHDLLTAR